MMLIGVPQGYQGSRVSGWTDPDSVGEFVAHGHKVLVETQAGAGIGRSVGIFGTTLKTVYSTRAALEEYAPRRPGDVEITPSRFFDMMTSFDGSAIAASRDRRLSTSG